MKHVLYVKKTFTEEDDVVACPECGTPYHRSCYKEKKQCINQALHASHRSWMAENFSRKVVENENLHICAKCGCPNPENAELCKMCGTLLSEKSNAEEDPNDPLSGFTGEMNDYFGFDENEIMDDESSITLGEMADYVKTNRLFYILVFKRLKTAAAKISLNVLAFLFPEYFFAGRKMYGWAAIAFIVTFLLSIPAFLSDMSSYNSEVNIFGNAFSEFFALHPVNMNIMRFCAAADAAFRILTGLTANMIYYRTVVARLKKMRKVSAEPNVYRLRVKTEGGVSYWSVIVLLLVHFLLLLLFFGIMMAVIILK